MLFATWFFGMFAHLSLYLHLIYEAWYTLFYRTVNFRVDLYLSVRIKLTYWCRGNRKLTQDGVNVGVEQYGATLQYGLDVQTNEWSKAHWVKNIGEGWDAEFHNYQTEWTPDFMSFSVDGEEIGRITYPEGGMWEHGEFDTDWPGIGRSGGGSCNIIKWGFLLILFLRMQLYRRHKTFPIKWKFEGVSVFNLYMSQL